MNLPIPFHFSSLIPMMSTFIVSCHFLLDHIQFTLIHGPDIWGSYAILFFTSSDFTFTTRHCHYWALFLIWPSGFILSGVINNWPLFFPSSLLDTFLPGWGWRRCHFLVSYLFAFFILVKVFSCQEYSNGCHSHLQWTTFFQKTSHDPGPLGWPYKAWLIV